jgi:hypothetical protein
MLRILAILHKNKFDGVMIPDHSPQMTCSAPWHAGIAHTLGFMRAAMMALDRGFSSKTAAPGAIAGRTGQSMQNRNPALYHR